LESFQLVGVEFFKSFLTQLTDNEECQSLIKKHYFFQAFEVITQENQELTKQNAFLQDYLNELESSTMKAQALLDQIVT
jgi:heme oxygenase